MKYQNVSPHYSNNGDQRLTRQNAHRWSYGSRTNSNNNQCNISNNNNNYNFRSKNFNANNNKSFNNENFRNKNYRNDKDYFLPSENGVVINGGNNNNKQNHHLLSNPNNPNFRGNHGYNYNNNNHNLTNQNLMLNKFPNNSSEIDGNDGVNCSSNKTMQRSTSRDRAKLHRKNVQLTHSQQQTDDSLTDKVTSGSSPTSNIEHTSSFQSKTSTSKYVLSKHKQTSSPPVFKPLPIVFHESILSNINHLKSHDLVNLSNNEDGNVLSFENGNDNIVGEKGDNYKEWNTTMTTPPTTPTSSLKDKSITKKANHSVCSLSATEKSAKMKLSLIKLLRKNESKLLTPTVSSTTLSPETVDNNKLDQVVPFEQQSTAMQASATTLLPVPYKQLQCLPSSINYDQLINHNFIYPQSSPIVPAQYLNSNQPSIAYLPFSFHSPPICQTVDGNFVDAYTCAHQMQFYSPPFYSNTNSNVFMPKVAASSTSSSSSSSGVEHICQNLQYNHQQQYISQQLHNANGFVNYYNYYQNPATSQFAVQAHSSLLLSGNAAPTQMAHSQNATTSSSSLLQIPNTSGLPTFSYQTPNGYSQYPTAPYPYSYFYPNNTEPISTQQVMVDGWGNQSAPFYGNNSYNKTTYSNQGKKNYSNRYKKN